MAEYVTEYTPAPIKVGYKRDAEGQPLVEVGEYILGTQSDVSKMLKELSPSPAVPAATSRDAYARG